MDSPMMQDIQPADPSLRLDVDIMILDYLIFKANIGVFRDSKDEQEGGLGDGEATDTTERALEMVDGKSKTSFLVLFSFIFIAKNMLATCNPIPFFHRIHLRSKTLSITRKP